VFFLFPFGGGFFIFILIFIAFRFGRSLFRDLFDDNREIPPGWRRSFRNSRFFNNIDTPGYTVKKPKDAEHQIFRLANKLKGRLTVSDIVINTGMGIKDAEEAMNKMVDGMRVRMEIDNRGIVVYEFPEIIAKYEDTGRF